MKMTEQEIINYLKENKNKGVAFAFMPKEVQDWCKEHQDEPIFLRCSLNRWAKSETIACALDSLYALSGDYELKPSFTPQWEEFEIDENGMFSFEGKCYYYREDARFETENRDKFKGFGGWLFDVIWRLVLRVGDAENFMMEAYQRDTTVFPSIPVKIKFWRYKE